MSVAEKFTKTEKKAECHGSRDDDDDLPPREFWAFDFDIGRLTVFL